MFENHRKEKWFFLAVLFVLAILAFIFFLSLNAQAQKNEKPFIKIQEIKTTGGLTIWHVEDQTLPIISLKFIFKDQGTSFDTKDKQGLARLLSNTMDEGAGEFDAQSFQKQLSDNSISLGFNAGRDHFGGDIKTLSRNKEKAFELLSIALKSPRFDEESIMRMRDANIARIKSSLSEPDWISARILNDQFFKNHPYAQNSGGTISGLQNITQDDLRNAFERTISKDNLLIASAGAITAHEISEAADKIFGTLPSETKKTKLESVTHSTEPRIYLFQKDIPQTIIDIGLPVFDHKDPDYYALEVLNYIFGGAGFGSRLMEMAREKNGLTYGIYSRLQDMEYGDMMSISTSTKNENVGQILSIISTEMQKLRTDKVSEEELSDAKSYITGSMPLSLKSTEDFTNIALSLQAEDKPIDYLDTYDDKINAVTVDDVLRAANRVLKPDGMVTILVGNPTNINNAQKIESIPNVE